MTSDPPPSSSNGQSLPPRHRPSLDKLNKDTTEQDLWAFEDDLDLDLDEAPSKTGAGPAHRSSADIPEPREPRVTKAREPSNPLEGASPSKGAEKIQINVNKSRSRNQPSPPPVGISRAESEFDDLEHWDDVPKGPQIDELPPLQTSEPVAETPPAPAIPEPAAEIPADAAASQSTSPDEPDDDEFSPVKRGDTKPLPLHPHLRLSKVERIGLIALLALLAAGGLATIVFSLKRLPTESSRERINDFPIKGAMVEVDSASSHWRAPITDGSSPEIVRRGTALIPVLELRISGGTGAIRVLFRDEERTVVGDAVTHAVRGTGTLIIPATAGFDDLGMHAAYRTGGSKPWTIEVYEAASETAPGENFKRLFEMNISTDRR